MTNSLNPAFDDCKCWFAEDARRADSDDVLKDARVTHELLLAMDTEPFESITNVLQVLDGDMTFIDLNPPFAGIGFETFMAQHNWSDPVCAYRLAEHLERLRSAAMRSNQDAEREMAELRLSRAS